MARTKSQQDDSIWEAALEGLELQKQRIEEQIEHIRGLLGRSSGRRGRPPSKTAAPVVKKRVLSPAARKRIAAAQKRRWAEFRKVSHNNKAE